jgi:hypothetical protein
MVNNQSEQVAPPGGCNAPQYATPVEGLRIPGVRGIRVGEDGICELAGSRCVTLPAEQLDPPEFGPDGRRLCWQPHASGRHAGNQRDGA